LYHTGGESKAVFAERFNRTLKSSINAYMIESNTDKYIDILNELVEGYNNKIHSSIGEKPKMMFILKMLNRKLK
jgi:transposase InsO family protein